MRQVKSTLSISTSMQSDDAIITERVPTAERQATHLDLRSPVSYGTDTARRR